MSMLSFNINRAGTNLDEDQRRVLEEARSSCAHYTAAPDPIALGEEESEPLAQLAQRVT